MLIPANASAIPLTGNKAAYNGEARCLFKGGRKEATGAVVLIVRVTVVAPLPPEIWLAPNRQLLNAGSPEQPKLLTAP